MNLRSEKETGGPWCGRTIAIAIGEPWCKRLWIGQRISSNTKDALQCKIYALIQKICSNMKDMLRYKRHAQIQKSPRLQNICIYRLTRKSHICLFLLDDHGNAFGLIPAIIVWKDDHFIECSFQINSMAPSKRKISRIAFVTRLWQTTLNFYLMNDCAWL